MIIFRWTKIITIWRISCLIQTDSIINIHLYQPCFPQFMPRLIPTATVLSTFVFNNILFLFNCILNIVNGNSINANIYSSVQRQIQQDWTNREYIEVIVSNIKKITDFLNSFELSCRSKMAILDEELNKLERKIDFVEAKVTKGDTLN